MLLLKVAICDAGNKGAGRPRFRTAQPSMNFRDRSGPFRHGETCLSDDKTLRHNATYLRCISAGNVHDGFDHNSNRGNVTIRNCAAHNNGNNINFSTTNIAASLTIKNTISLGTNGGLSATTTDITNNSWQNGLSATNADFTSVDTSLLKSKRKSDGSLPDIDYFKLVPGSDLRNAGIDIGQPFNGSAPDLGPFESVE